MTPTTPPACACWECGIVPNDPKERAEVERGFKCWRCFGKETRELNPADWKRHIVKPRTATEDPK